MTGEQKAENIGEHNAWQYFNTHNLFSGITFQILITFVREQYVILLSPIFTLKYGLMLYLNMLQYQNL